MLGMGRVMNKVCIRELGQRLGRCGAGRDVQLRFIGLPPPETNGCAGPRPTNVRHLCHVPHPEGPHTSLLLTGVEVVKGHAGCQCGHRCPSIGVLQPSTGMEGIRDHSPPAHNNMMSNLSPATPRQSEPPDRSGGPHTVAVAVHVCDRTNV